jgi:WD40 repeat protein
MAVAYSPDGRRALTGSRDGTARLWDMDRYEPVLEPLRHEAEVGAVAFSPDGRTLATGALDGVAQTWDAQTGSPLGAPLRHAGGIRSIAFSPDGRALATGSMDGKVRRWRVPLPPVKGDAARVLHRIYQITEMEMDDRGAIRALTSEKMHRLPTR